MVVGCVGCLSTGEVVWCADGCPSLVFCLIKNVEVRSCAVLDDVPLRVRSCNARLDVLVLSSVLLKCSGEIV